MLLRMLTAATMGLTAAVAGAAAHPAAPRAADNACLQYGYLPHTRDYRTCILNVRHYWSTGPCADGRFAAAHRRYCHLVPEFDF